MSGGNRRRIAMRECVAEKSRHLVGIGRGADVEVDHGRL